MNRWLKSTNGPEDELGRDMALAQTLEALDPASVDPNYWLRFRGWVMTDASGELARRRLMVELTVGDVLTSWARMVVPTAALAAALAGMLLVRSDSIPNQYPVGVEELLVAEASREMVQLLFSSDDAPSAATFASEIF